jgi:hypothetical protein
MDETKEENAITEYPAQVVEPKLEKRIQLCHAPTTLRVAHIPPCT